MIADSVAQYAVFVSRLAVGVWTVVRVVSCCVHCVFCYAVSELGFSQGVFLPLWVFSSLGSRPPPLTRSVRVLIMRRRQTFEKRGRMFSNVCRLRIIKTRTERVNGGGLEPRLGFFLCFFPLADVGHHPPKCCSFFACAPSSCVCSVL